MQEHERFGHDFQIRDRQLACEDHLKTVRVEIVAERPESRRVAKGRWRQVVSAMGI